ncbi:MAG: hypothetical protein HY551_02655 [Elusimicrobia bacterium]|nr:hypothetical protein [Elusimicrobiota bacterium]
MNTRQDRRASSGKTVLLAGVNAHLQGFIDGRNAGKKTTFDSLRKAGLIFAFDDPGKTRFLYANWCKGEKAGHMVFGCRVAPSDEDDAEAAEPALRKRFEKTGIADGCDRNKPK